VISSSVTPAIAGVGASNTARRPNTKAAPAIAPAVANGERGTPAAG
jgi:hypothetical protein